jgi:hypothetical protein
LRQARRSFAAWGDGPGSSRSSRARPPPGRCPGRSRSDRLSAHALPSRGPLRAGLMSTLKLLSYYDRGARTAGPHQLPQVGVRRHGEPRVDRQRRRPVADLAAAAPAEEGDPGTSVQRKSIPRRPRRRCGALSSRESSYRRTSLLARRHLYMIKYAKSWEVGSGLLSPSNEGFKRGRVMTK